MYIARCIGYIGWQWDRNSKQESPGLYSRVLDFSNINNNTHEINAYYVPNPILNVY